MAMAWLRGGRDAPTALRECACITPDDDSGSIRGSISFLLIEIRGVVPPLPVALALSVFLWEGLVLCWSYVASLPLHCKPC